MSRRGGRGRRKFGDTGFEAWGGYMNAKKAKLEEQFSDDVSAKDDRDKKSDIFNGVAIFVNGYTDPTADELKRIMMTHGGVYHHYESSRTTHIIASNLPDTKVKNLKGNEIICKPSWITDSLKAEKLLDFTNYLLYSNQSKTQPKINFPKLPSAGPSSNKSSKPLDAKDEKFLGEYYNNSRLHHISSMGAAFKEYVGDLRSSRSPADLASARQRLKPSVPPYKPDHPGDKIIMHIDMDCFFVSVGLRNHPHLKGKPVAVTHSKGGSSRPVQSNAESLSIEMAAYRDRLERKAPSKELSEEHDKKVKEVGEAATVSMAEIASCSYEARAAGVKNGMFMGAALKLCPDLKTIPYDFESYQIVAKTLYDTVAEYTLDIQAVSCDEMLVDLSGVVRDRSISPEDFAEHLRREIREKTDCNASVGIGTSILLARVATRKAKPDGVYFLRKVDAADYMKNVKVGDLPGVGRTNNHKFRAMGVENCGQLQDLSLGQLQKDFGSKLGSSIFNYCRGIDDRQLSLEHERKSVSAEVNYGIRFTNETEMERFLGQLSEEVSSRLLKLGNAKGRSITLKIMVRAANAPLETAKHLGHGLCDSFSKGSTMASATNDPSVIKREVMILMKKLNANPTELRGIGVQVSKLEKTSHESSSSTKSITNYMTKPSTSGSNIVSSPVASTSKSSVKTSEKESHFLSLSQVDEDILDELPEDIQNEIKAAMKATRKTKEETEPKSNKSDVKLQQDLSFSQLDPDVLAELPPDVVEELKRDYNKQKAKAANPTPKTAFEVMMNQKSAVSSPPPLTALTTTTGKKRGRPSKNSPRFIKKSVKSSSSTPVLASSSNPSSVISAKRSLFDTEEPEREEDPEVKVDPPAEKPKASLNGKRSIQDLRLMFREWVRSTRFPFDEDVETVSDFMINLVNEEDTEAVYAAMKSFCRICKTEGNNGQWSCAYNKILRDVQYAFTKNFGKRLFVNFNF